MTGDRNCALKEKIIALAQRHRLYGAGMIYLKLRQAGELVNYKRVDRLYAEAGLQVRKRKRKKIPIAELHPCARPRDRRSLAPGIQRGATQEVPWRTDPSGLCQNIDAKPVKLTPDSKAQCY